MDEWHQHSYIQKNMKGILLPILSKLEDLRKELSAEIVELPRLKAMYPDGTVIQDTRPEGERHAKVEWRRLLFRAVTHVIQNPSHVNHNGNKHDDTDYVKDFCIPLFQQLCSLIVIAIRIAEGDNKLGGGAPSQEPVEKAQGGGAESPSLDPAQEMARHILQFSLSSVSYMFRDKSRKDKFAKELSKQPAERLKKDIDHLMDGIRYCMRGAAALGFSTCDARMKRVVRNNLDLASWALKCLSRLCRLVVHQEDRVACAPSSSTLYESQQRAKTQNKHEKAAVMVRSAS